MFRELIDKLRLKKKQLQGYTSNNETNENKPTQEQRDFEITISKENNISKMEISDYISIIDYAERMDFYELINGDRLSDLISNAVLWNNGRQKVNKGTYYVISNGNRLYNILINDEKIAIDERTKIEIDEQTQKENVTEERVITFDINKNEYHFFWAKHDKTGSTYHTKYYDKIRLFSLGTLDLSADEAYDEISSFIYNLESIDGMDNIIDIELFKKEVLEDLGKRKEYKKM